MQTSVLADDLPCAAGQPSPAPAPTVMVTPSMSARNQTEAPRQPAPRQSAWSNARVRLLSIFAHKLVFQRTLHPHQLQVAMPCGAMVSSLACLICSQQRRSPPSQSHLQSYPELLQQPSPCSRSSLSSPANSRWLLHSLLTALALLLASMAPHQGCSQAPQVTGASRRLHMQMLPGLVRCTLPAVLFCGHSSICRNDDCKCC